VDVELGPRTKAAIARFQRKHMKRRDADGKLDAATRDAIQKAHGA
jgi:hypothetical protein